ncbi:MAG: FtsQ-type POTRA domain-containing protein [Alphaproteobacteria bacterium]|nr:FtsQ-type POTRA domain-containing protein [Alphaproteobacteria bacterium]
MLNNMQKENEQKQTNNKIVLPVCEWPARLKATLFVLVCSFVIAILIVVLKNDLVNKKIDEFKVSVLNYVGNKAFALEDIVVTGRVRTTIDEINKVLELHRGDNLLAVDVKDIKRKLEFLPWVRDVDVSINFFPNVLKIEIKEKDILAIWQLNEKFYPLDMDGYVIEADYRPDKPILLVVGAGAAENILSFIKMVKEVSPQYFDRIKVANFISKRRWNIILDDIRNGVTVKLPEDNLEKAWKKLLKLDETRGILKRKLTIIDLRLDGKVTVKLRKSRSVEKRSDYEM